MSECWLGMGIPYRAGSYSPKYPPATRDEYLKLRSKGVGCPQNESVDLTQDVILGCGLTPYQERVSEHLNPDIWEILQFNDKRTNSYCES